MINDNQKIKKLIESARRDPDAASVFYFGNELDTDGAVIVIKPKKTAEAVVKWLLNQKLTTENPIPEKEEKQK